MCLVFPERVISGPACMDRLSPYLCVQENVQ